MEANYVGPGWYWVENVEQPLFVSKDANTGDLWATHTGVRFNIGHTAINITHIPRPSQRPVVDWSVMPAWAKWVAMDDKGRWFWSSVKLSHVFGVWDFDLEDKSTTRIHGDVPAGHSPTYTGDWRNSLVERPE